MPSFKVEPVYLSPEHARQVERFTGCPYDPEGDASIRAWVAFKRYEHGLHLAKARAKLIAFLEFRRIVLLVRQQQGLGPGVPHDYLQLHDPAHGRVVNLGIPDVTQINWDVLSQDDALAFAAEAIDSGEAEEVLTLSWDFGTPMHNGINTFWEIGDRLFVDCDEGMLGPFPSLGSALEESERNKPLGAGMNYESNSLTASEIAAQLGSDYLTVGEEILINGERWLANADNGFSRIEGRQ